MNTSWIRELVQRDEVESTSDLARALVADPAVALPLLVTARRQTRGRGRGANVWFSGDGSLMFTVALDPAAHRLDPALEPAVALAAALAVIDAARALGGPAQLAIRWPNDVEINGRKLAGILPERVETPRGPRLLIGV
ncbi:MAG: biotin--[acetyl-CoA-carboxylase] ligase, partial [Planctomycetota bacterium]|nr:biotin--[acetyl-CoA-carboxylase] ligase [Planctomycetota bacterium]